MANETTLVIGIGNKIDEVLKSKNMNRSELARALGVTPPSVSYMMNRDKIDALTLAKVSRILKHNFLKYYYVEEEGAEEQKKAATDENTRKLMARIGELESQVKELKQELVRKENEYLKKINSLLELQVER